MRNGKYLVCCAAFTLALCTGFSQTYQPGDKVEAFINNTWKEMKVVKSVQGKKHIYELQPAIAGQRGSVKNHVQVANGNIRSLAEAPAVLAGNSLRLGKYELYSGIPTLYLGHLVLLKDGKYKLAFSTGEDNYENGAYVFHAGTNTIEWLSGMFRNKNWGGKLVSQGDGYRIEFNKTTYADSN